MDRKGLFLCCVTLSRHPQGNIPVDFRNNINVTIFNKGGKSNNASSNGIFMPSATGKVNVIVLLLSGKCVDSITKRCHEPCDNSEKKMGITPATTHGLLTTTIECINQQAL